MAIFFTSKWGWSTYTQSLLPAYVVVNFASYILILTSYFFYVTVLIKWIEISSLFLSTCLPLFLSSTLTPFPTYTVSPSPTIVPHPLLLYPHPLLLYPHPLLFFSLPLHFFPPPLTFFPPPLLFISFSPFYFSTPKYSFPSHKTILPNFLKKKYMNFNSIKGKKNNNNGRKKGRGLEICLLAFH